MRVVVVNRFGCVQVLPHITIYVHIACRNRKNAREKRLWYSPLKTAFIFIISPLAPPYIHFAFSPQCFFYHPSFHSDRHIAPHMARFLSPFTHFKCPLFVSTIRIVSPKIYFPLKYLLFFFTKLLHSPKTIIFVFIFYFSCISTC